MHSAAKCVRRGLSVLAWAEVRERVQGETRLCPLGDGMPAIVVR